MQNFQHSSPTELEQTTARKQANMIQILLLNININNKVLAAVVEKKKQKNCDILKAFGKSFAPLQGHFKGQNP